MRKFLIPAVLLIFTVLSAEFVQLEKANKVAVNYYGHYCAEAASKGSAVINVLEHSYKGIITRYTFEFDKGFVIVTADDDLYPILGYSDHGKVPSDDAKGGQNFKEWFEEYDRQIACKGSGKYVDENASDLWKNIENNIFPAGKAGIIVDRLVKSQWGQLYPWNLMCPEKDGEETYVGCVATAMAQLLRYHRYPDAGEGSVSYEWNSQTLSADLSSHTWNYDLMPEVLNIEYGIYPEYWESGITQDEKDELSLLSYWTGLSVDMNYGTQEEEGSWAYAAPVDDAFTDHWKASSSVYYTMETPPAGGVDPQYDTIKAELDAKRPWFWAGGAHAFILDGYRDDYWYHFNWGWEGNYDGWFHRSSLVPGGSGSCDTGGGDFTESQLGITYVPSYDPYDQWPASDLYGSVENGDDVKLNWTLNYSSTGFKIYRSKDKISTPELIAEIYGAEDKYTDYDLPEGEYSYYIITVYLDGESHNSNSYSVEIASQEAYPEIYNLNAEMNGRTSIDLGWTAPFTGTLYCYEDFDRYYIQMPPGWLGKTSRNLSGQSCWTNDPDDWVTVESEDNCTAWLYHDRLDGSFVLMSAYATETLWLLSPEIEFGDDSEIRWWNRFRYSDNDSIIVAERPYFEVVSYSGAFDEVDRETSIVYQTHAVYDGDSSPENIWEYEETADLSSLAGTTARVGFRVPVNNNDMYTLAFDMITISSPHSDTIEVCQGYEIFRNGIKAADVPVSGSDAESWSDTFYEDGINEYYVKAVYPTGISLPSERIVIETDKFPKPDFLTGEYEIWSDAVLSWYAPYYNPPKWYAYGLPENSTYVADNLDGVAMTKRRTLFRAADLGYTYPVTVDSVSAVFFDDSGDGNWGGENTFIFRISSADQQYIYSESPVLTAVHKQATKYAFPTPLVINDDFNLEIVTTNSSGYPGVLAVPGSKEAIHSLFYNEEMDSYNYYMINPDDGIPYEWMHLAYITSSSPEESTVSKYASDCDFELKSIIAENRESLDHPVESFKGLDYYKIYRNNTLIGTTTATNYADHPGVLDYLVYKVTAYYSDPEGESEPSNEVLLWGTGIGDDQNVPLTTELYQNYPNPFNPETTIKYSLADEGIVKLAVYDVTGREVVSLVNSRQAKGFHEARFNAGNMTSGVYIYKLSVNDKVLASKKMMMVK